MERKRRERREKRKGEERSAEERKAMSHPKEYTSTRRLGLPDTKTICSPGQHLLRPSPLYIESPLLP